MSELDYIKGLDVSPKQLEKIERKERFKTDFKGFCKHYFDIVPTKEQLYWHELKLEHPELLILASVGHGKTKHFMFLEPIHEICYNRNMRALYSACSEELTSENVGLIIKQLETNEKLITDYGFFKPDQANPWGDKHGYLIERDDTLSKEPTIIGKSKGSSIEGIRPNRWLGDDIIDEESGKSPAQRDRDLNWLTATLLPRLEPGSRKTMIGSRWHPRDVYYDVSQMERFFVIERPAIDPTFLRRYDTMSETERNKLSKEELDSHCLSPDLVIVNEETGKAYPRDFAYLMKERGNTRKQRDMFELRYMCNPLVLVGMKWELWWIDGDEDKDMPSKWFSHIEGVPASEFGKFLTLFQYWDFAFSRKTYGDYTVCATGGVDKRNYLYLLDLYMARISEGHVRKMEQQKEECKLKFGAYPFQIGYETNNAKALVPYVRESKLLNNTKEIYHSGSSKIHSKRTSKEDRIGVLQPLLETKEGRLKIYEGIGHRDAFLEEYTSFPGNIDSHSLHDDILDAVAGLYEVSVLGGFGGTSIKTSDRMDTMATRPTGLRFNRYLPSRRNIRREYGRGY